MGPFYYFICQLTEPPVPLSHPSSYHEALLLKKNPSSFHWKGLEIMITQWRHICLNRVWLWCTVSHYNKPDQSSEDGRAGAGNVQEGPGTSVTPDSKETTKARVTSKALRSQPEEVPNGQRQDNLSFKQDNNCNWLKFIKYVKIHEIIIC